MVLTRGTARCCAGQNEVVRVGKDVSAFKVGVGDRSAHVGWRAHGLWRKEKGVFDMFRLCSTGFGLLHKFRRVSEECCVRHMKCVSDDVVKRCWQSA